MPSYLELLQSCRLSKTVQFFVDVTDGTDATLWNFLIKNMKYAIIQTLEVH